MSAIGTGALGLFLPIVPTTPFLLLALWAASRGAPDLHARIRTHPRFAATLNAWERERAVPVRAKWLACVILFASWQVLWWSSAPAWLLTTTALLFLALALFLLSRPAPALRR